MQKFYKLITREYSVRILGIQFMETVPLN